MDAPLEDVSLGSSPLKTQTQTQIVKVKKKSLRKKSPPKLSIKQNLILEKLKLFYENKYIEFNNLNVVHNGTDIEILEQDKLIEKEIKDGIIPDPATIGPDGQPLDPAAGAGGMDLGAPVMEPEIDGSPTEAPELPKGGEI